MLPNQALGRRRDFHKAQSQEECRTEERGIGTTSNKLRILFANVAGIPMEPNSQKNEAIQRWINNSSADIIGLAETNVCWHKARGGPLHERVKKWTETSEPHLRTNLHSSIAYNELEEYPNEYQIGGTALLTRGGMSCRIMGKGQDAIRLGRWSWTDYRGVQGIKLRIICAYRLVATSNRGGTETVHAQHLRALHKIGRDTSPIKAFDDDLFGFIKESKEEGYQIIVMMDANANVRDSVFTQRMRKEGLKDQLSTQIENANTNSFFRGTDIIDGIFLSRTIVQLNGGYQSFEASPGDHRGIWIDICSMTALGNNNPIALPRQPRRLQTKMLTTVKKFNKVYQQHIDDHKLGQRARRLREVAHYPLSIEQSREFEEIDLQMVIGMKKADKQCRKLNMGAVQWTPQYTETNEKILVLGMILKKRKGAKIKTSVIKRTMKKANLPRKILTLTSSEIRILESEAHQDRRQYKQIHVQKRNQWLDSQSLVFDRGKPKIAGKIRAKKNREEMRRTSNRIKNALKPFKPRGVTKIVVNGEEITTHEGIVEGFKADAIKRGSQTEDTPFMTEPLLSEFGYKADNSNAEKVLEGTYVPPPTTDEYAIKLLPHLQRPAGIKKQGPIKSDISKKEYIKAWKTKREYTGSGPSGLHYGHFKAMAWNDNSASLHTDMINIPLTTGYSPERWRLADDHLEQKKPDNFNVDRYRPITHVEADFNMANGFIGRKVMGNAEKHDILAPEQYGSRKGKSAQDQALNKRLMFDIARQSKKPMVLVANDAKSCYDRIVHVMVMLCARRTGLDLEPILAMIDTIQLMAHQIHTAYGSSLGYGPDDWDVPFQGMLQGNQFGPPSWCIVSSPMFDMLRAEGFGLRLCSPMTRAELHLAGLAFVDDTDTGQNEKRPNETGEEVLRHAQGNVDHWNGAIRTTGGALDPNKTHWYLLDFLWRHGVWKYAGLDDSNNLTMVDSEGNRVNLQQLPVSKGMRTLGVILAPDGNNDDQVAALVEKAEQWAELITTGHLEREEAWRALNSTILKALEYPLTATTLTQQETTRIFAPVRKAALPASGIVRTFPSAIAHAPLRYQGLAIPDLYATQQTKHVMTLLKFGGTNTVTGIMIQHSLELLKIEIGVSRPLQELRLANIAFLATDSWVKTTWLFMEKYYLTINEEPQFMLRREQDGYLMEQFYNGQFPQKSLKAINRCRLYHKILTLSDILTGTGDKIRSDIWTSQQNIQHDERDDWPRQGTPSEADWRIWEQSILTLFNCRSHDSTISPQLQLGQGKVTDSWKWYYHQDTVYEKAGGITKEYSQQGTRLSRRKRYREKGIIQQVPSLACPCTVEKDGVNIIFTGVIRPEVEATDENHLSPFMFYLKNKMIQAIVPEQYIWMLEDSDPPTEKQMQQLKESLEANELVGCTDASTKDGISTASFKFQTKEGITVLQGEVLVPGDDKIQCSHRGEMGGAAAALTYLQMVTDYKQIRTGRVHFGCDSDNVVNVGLYQQKETNSVAEHYDLVRACHRARKALHPIEVVPVHVQGHTDHLSRKKTIMEKMNIECDTRAGKRWKKAQKEKNIMPEPSQIGYWQLFHHDEPILTKLTEKIRLSLQEFDAFEYWTEKNYNPIRENGDDVKGSAFHTIHWSAIDKAMKSSSQYKRHFVAKHATGHCAVGKMMKRWGFRKKDNCPRCRKENETALHVITCQHKTAKEEWDVEINNFQQWMSHNGTAPAISLAMTYNLRKWRKSGGIYGHHYQDNRIKRAIKQQEKIGWDHFLLGRISQQWSEIQAKHYKNIGSKKTGERWAEILIKEIWRIHCSIWNGRNEILHGTGNHVVLGTKVYEKEIEKELNKGSKLILNSDKYLFRGISMVDVRKWKADKKQKWLDTVTAARHMSSLRHQETQQPRENMRNWLNGKTTQDN